jgi:digeranylgeranylglycerophospholipid reductase
MKYTCDVLVVGAGPAGSSAAATCAKNGLNTMLVEKNHSPGENIQCAETISQYLLDKLHFKIPAELLNWRLDGMKFWTRNLELFNYGREWQGYNISRSIFDKWVADRAAKNGAKVFCNSKVVGLEYDSNNFINEVHVRQNESISTVLPKYVIAADGVHSTVARRMGIFKKKKNSIGSVLAFDVGNISLNHSRLDQIFFGDFAPSAYAYIMPKSKSTAGIGVGTSIDRRRSKLEDYFIQFTNLPSIKGQLNRFKIIDEKSGDAPISKSIDEVAIGNVAFCGDSANQNIKPFLEGILPGIISGDETAKYIFSQFKKDARLRGGEMQSRIDKRLPLISESSKINAIIQSENKINSGIRDLISMGIFSGRINPAELKNFLDMSETELVSNLRSKKR